MASYRFLAGFACLAFGAAVVGGTGCKGRRPDRADLVRILVSMPAGSASDQLLDAKLEIAGAVGDRISVDVPKAKLPADLRTVTVTMSYATACGRKSFSFPLPPQEFPQAGADPYQLTPADKSQLATFDFSYSGRVPKLPPLPAVSHVLFDPAYSGPVEIGGRTVTIQRGALEGGRPEDGIALSDLTCATSIKLGGRTLAIPKPPPGTIDNLFVTAEATKCFEDESVGYGSLPSSTTMRQGENLYWLKGRTYEFWFRPADDSTKIARGAGGTVLHRLGVCP